jgi:hypothetical protein
MNNSNIDMLVDADIDGGKEKERGSSGKEDDEEEELD